MKTDNEFARFLNLGKWDEQCCYISAEKLSEEQQLMVLRQKDDLSLHAALAKNPHVTPKAQLIIARRRDSDYDEARENLAENESCCQDAQGWLANDPEELVRKALAFNRNLSYKAAKKLLKDDSVEVLSCLGCNYFTGKDWGEEIHESLSKNGRYVRFEASILAELSGANA